MEIQATLIKMKPWSKHRLTGEEHAAMANALAKGLWIAPNEEEKW